MDIPAVDNQKQPISDDQELAKALAGVTQEADSMGFESTGGLPAVSVPVTDAATLPMPDPIAIQDSTAIAPPPAPAAPVATVDPGLATVKQAALSELRPLIGKLDVSPEEKFNTYLLLIRSTDDRDLIAPAHEAAAAITDEAKKAQALLDIIKEIDYLSSSQSAA